MKIVGIEKTTLIDFPNKIACTIFTHGCNFRCGFCHNPELVIQNVELELSKKEILDFLFKRKNYLQGICITGGEPLIDVDLNFLKEIKSLGYLIKIDTNGSFPEKLEEIIKNDLVDFIAMDIKSSKEKYKEITNSNIDIKKIEKSIKLIFNSRKEYEFRTTTIPDFHDKEEIEKICLWLNEICDGKPEKFVLQGFKNQGKFINPELKLKKDSSQKELEILKKIAEEFFKKIEIR